MSKSIRNTKILVFGALMTAMSIVIGMLCKTYLTFGDGSIRVTFENLPIILSGIWFGPAVGCAVGVVSDIISALLSPPYSVNFLITLGAASIGLVSGMVSRYIIKGKAFIKTLGITLCAHIIGSIIIKSTMLGIIGYAVVWSVRIPLYLLIAVCEAYLIFVIRNNRGIASRVERLVKNDI